MIYVALVSELDDDVFGYLLVVEYHWLCVFLIVEQSKLVDCLLLSNWPDCALVVWQVQFINDLFDN